MTTRFTVKDHQEARRATAALPDAARELAGRVGAAASKLGQIELGATPAEALAALVRWRTAQPRLSSSEGQLLLLLQETGASSRSLADALKMHKSTVDRLIAQARADRDAGG